MDCSGPSQSIEEPASDRETAFPARPPAGSPCRRGRGGRYGAYGYGPRSASKRLAQPYVCRIRPESPKISRRRHPLLGGSEAGRLFHQVRAHTSGKLCGLERELQLGIPLVGDGCDETSQVRQRAGEVSDLRVHTARLEERLGEAEDGRVIGTRVIVAEKEALVANEYIDCGQILTCLVDNLGFGKARNALVEAALAEVFPTNPQRLLNLSRQRTKIADHGLHEEIPAALVEELVVDDDPVKVVFERALNHLAQSLLLGGQLRIRVPQSALEIVDDEAAVGNLRVADADEGYLAARSNVGNGYRNELMLDAEDPEIGLKFRGKGGKARDERRQVILSERDRVQFQDGVGVDPEVVIRVQVDGILLHINSIGQ
ncbi:hypothetical protein DDI_1204 [Dickeya dianthicola RNS04.9]|nr:hypothetical protein DDI_1204 [Dickeya dianthicola RNS04.9]